MYVLESAGILLEAQCSLPLRLADDCETLKSRLSLRMRIACALHGKSLSVCSDAQKRQTCFALPQSLRQTLRLRAQRELSEHSARGGIAVLSKHSAPRCFAPHRSMYAWQSPGNRCNSANCITLQINTKGDAFLLFQLFGCQTEC